MKERKIPLESKKPEKNRAISIKNKIFQKTY
jgi:hypothetical protein